MCNFCGLSSGALRSQPNAAGRDYAGTPLAAIDWGTSLNLSDGVLTVGFYEGGLDISVPADGSGFPSFNLASVAWRPAEIDAAIRALEIYSDYIPLEIEVVDVGSADFRLAKSPDVSGAFFLPPGEPAAGFGAFEASLFTEENGANVPGAFNFIFLLHEFGHGFGLAHPHDNGGSSDLMRGVGNEADVGAFGLNQTVHTVMSYVDGWATGPLGLTPSNDWGNAKTPSPLDVAVLQDKYGANLTHARGDDVYVLPDVNDDGTGFSTIWDTGGNDTIVYRGGRDVVIRLEAATLQYEPGGGGDVSHASGIYGGFTIANGVVVEGARGGAGDDDIRGNAADNTLAGNGGRDTIDGEAGNDRVSGGDRGDRLDGGPGDDTLKGEAGADRISGNAGNDQINGGGGNDFLLGFVGNDLLIGGGGSDELDGGAGRDLLRGQADDDRLAGRAGSDTIAGGDGRDVLQGGTGNDRLSGRDGRDLLSGGNGADTLLGGAGPDRLEGGAKDDRLSGGPGDDRIIGEAGNDRIVGGPGSDRFVVGPGDGDSRIVDLVPGEDTIVLKGFGFSDAGDVLDTAVATDRGVRLVLDAQTSILLLGVDPSALSAGDFII